MTTRSLSNFSPRLARAVTVLTILSSIPFLSFYWMTSAQLIPDAVLASSNHGWLTPLSIALYLPFAVAATFVFGNLYAYILVSIAGIGIACVGLMWGRPNWLLRIWLLLVILAIVVFPFVLRYHPALTSAPGYEMQVVTDPGFFGGIVKASQNLVERTPCDYQLIGWSADNQLYYEAMCGTRAQIWRYSPTQPGRHTQISSRPKELGGYEMPKERLLEIVRADGVRPREYESVTRPILLESSGLVSPDGHWVALVTQHVYGTQDVILLTTCAISPTTVVRRQPPPGAYLANADEALWAHVDAAWDKEMAHRTTITLQRQPWWDGEIILFTYEDNLPEWAGGGRQQVLSWVLTEPDPIDAGWTVVMSGNEEVVRWPWDRPVPIPAEIGLYSFWLSERQDDPGRTMSVIYGLWDTGLGEAPPKLELALDSASREVSLVNDSFLYVAEGYLADERPQITWDCGAPDGSLCGIGVYSDELPDTLEPLVFADQIRSHAQTLDSLTGQLVPFTVGRSDPKDPFAPGTLTTPAQVHFSLHWQVLAPPSADWRVFVHLLNEAGDLVLQSDAAVDWPAQPCADGQYGPECTVASEHEWAFPAGFPTGLYTITVGLYDPATGARAPITSPPGATSSFSLGQVWVTTEDETQVTLGIFSGRPDPTWTIDPVQETQLRQQINLLPPTQEPFDNTIWLPSGYHGFTVRLPAADGQPSQLVEVYQGVVQVETEGRVVRMADEDWVVERWLLDTAGGHVEEDIIEAIREDLDAAAPATTTRIVHIIQEGDTVLSIAARYGTSMDAILAANALDDVSLLKVGQELLITVSTETSDTIPLVNSVSLTICQSSDT